MVPFDRPIGMDFLDNVEAINMLEGLVDEEVDQYLTENPKIIPLFEVDMV